MEPLRPERNGSETRLRLAGKVYVAISMAASLALLAASGLHIKAPVLFLVVLLLFLRYMLKEFDQLAGIEQWRQSLADRLEDVGVPPFLFTMSAVSLLAMNQTGVWGTILRVIATLGCMGMLTSALIQIHDEQGRASVHRSLRPLGGLAPLVYTFLLVLLAATFFGALLSWLSLLGWTDIGPGGGPSMISVGKGMYFFVWHLVRSIPVLEITDSFGWENPIQYKRNILIGLLVVLYKLAVLIPVTAYATYHWTHRRDADLRPSEESDAG